MLRFEEEEKLFFIIWLVSFEQKAIQLIQFVKTFSKERKFVGFC